MNSGLMFNSVLKQVGQVVILLVVIALVLLGVSNPIFSYAALGISALCIVAFKPEESMCFMMFIVPFANIFKAGVQSTSFFTYLTLLLAIKLLFGKRNFSSVFVVIWIAMFIYQAVGCDMQVTVLIKQAAILLIVYGYFNFCKVDPKALTMSFTAGLILSCIVAVNSDLIPGLSMFMQIIKTFELEVNVIRFTGLYVDPNFLTLASVMSMSSILVLVKEKRMSKYAMIPCLIVTYFGLMTSSKSFFLMLAIIAVLYIVHSFKNKDYFAAVCGIVIIAVVVVLTINGTIGLFANFMARLRYSDDITTGRTDIWLRYIKHILDSPLNLIFGFGIAAPILRKAAHSTYIDFIYFYGLVGSALFISGIVVSMSKKRITYRISNIAVFVCFAFLLTSLSYLQIYDFTFMLILALSFLVKPAKDVDELAEGLTL